MTESTMKAAHYRLWDWLAKNQARNKFEWPEWENNGGDIPKVLSDCFACEVDKQERTAKDHPCSRCPISDEACSERGRSGTYVKWFDSDDNDERRKLAEIIRDSWRKIE